MGGTQTHTTTDCTVRGLEQDDVERQLASEVYRLTAIEWRHGRPCLTHAPDTLTADVTEANIPHTWHQMHPHGEPDVVEVEGERIAVWTENGRTLAEWKLSVELIP